ncbi:MAG: hypothetical protein PHU11_04765 [Dysgonamonadaceae bacterium]|nr:hypothetical protein [Dysgonamonadaceae bacterium]
MKYLILVLSIFLFIKADEISPKYEYNLLENSCLKDQNANSCISVGFLNETFNLDRTEYIQKIQLKYSFFNILPIATMNKFYNFSTNLNLENNQLKAFKMYERACFYNNAIGCTLAGFNVKQENQKEGFFLRSCYELKNGNGCLMLGLYYQSQKKYNEAKKSYRLGCNMREKQACSKLGSIYSNIEKDYDKGHEFHELGCKLSNYYDSMECYLAFPSRMSLGEDEKTHVKYGGLDRDGDAIDCSYAKVKGVNKGNDQFLMVRSKPNEKAGSLDKLHENDTLWICDWNQDWYGIIYGKGCSPNSIATEKRKFYQDTAECHTGWVFSRYIEILAG